jgi:DNA-binding CsgD family transcriptional regulator
VKQRGGIGGGPTGAIEHFKTLCCLGLKPESAMVAVTPLLHEIIPHGWTAIALLEPDSSMRQSYMEHQDAGPHLQEHLWRFMDDPAALISLWRPAFRAAGIGWTLHKQGQGYLESAYYQEIEAPIDTCWVLDAMIADGGRSIAAVYLKRPRSARPFTSDHVQRLDRLRPWLAYAFRQETCVGAQAAAFDPRCVAGTPVMFGEIILTAEGKAVFQTRGIEPLLGILAGDPSDYTRRPRARDGIPAQVLKVLQRIIGAASGIAGDPPRMQIPTRYGVVSLEAKWLMPAGVIAEDAAKDPKSCLIAVTAELLEHPLAHAARVLREGGATPAQTKVGIQLVLGKTKPVIADGLGIKPTTVADLTRKLYQTFDVHNATELGTKIWLGQKQGEARQISRHPG